MIRSFIRPRTLTYILIIFVLIVAVRARQAVVVKDRVKEVPTYLREIDNNGKPVTVCMVRKRTFDETVKLTVIPASGSRFSGYVTRRTAALLKEGQAVKTLGNGSSVKGEIAYLSPEIDMMSGLYNLEVEFKEPVKSASGKLIIEADVGEMSDVIEVPNDALQIDDGEFYVWVVEDGRAERTRVELSVRGGYYSVVSSGLDEDEVLVLTGQSRLEEGDKVRIMKEENHI